ncbi:hypothetical protein HanRHA438_Chr11g0501201 [Helianthus annuus]|nr:hypothetical protein HanRHA438_Chr11g0501201 [Helianthus annuus]
MPGSRFGLLISGDSNADNGEVVVMFGLFLDVARVRSNPVQLRFGLGLAGVISE